MDWQWIEVITNEPLRIVRYGSSGASPVEFYVIEVLSRCCATAPFTPQLMVLTAQEFHMLNR
jgi:hypothetical protein